MVVGIDLGTTNSLVGSGDEMFSSLVSSNVDVSTGQQVARDVTGPDIVSSYKTNMSIGDTGKLSVKCSSVILKKLVELAERRSGETVDEAVISVPAYFSTSQREAVIKAANDAGIKVRGLLNEPTAAALFVCRSLQDLIIVYDLGGGTFDVTIIDSRVGSYSVVATDGTVIGGDDLDMALVEHAIKQCKIPLRYQNQLNISKLKCQMRLVKESIQRTKQTEYLDLSAYGAKTDYELTVEEYKQIVRKVFGDTVVKTNEVISRNLPSTERPKLVFVGGSTADPFVREMVLESTGLEQVENEYNPDLIVAKGVALYAKLVENGTAEDIVEDVTKRLCIEDDRHATITVIDSNSIIPCVNSRTVYNTEAGDKLILKLYQGDKLMAADNDYIGTLVYNYGREVAPYEGVVEISISVSVSGVVTLSAFEVLFGEGSMQEIELTAR